MQFNAKKLAAEKATEYIEEGMIVGLGTGSTAYWAIRKIGEKVKEGFDIKAVASSKESEKIALESGISLVSFSDIKIIDITIDGADEADKQYNLIKGGGGALLREKILAYNSKKFFVVIDESKRVDTIGNFPLPVEIIHFGHALTLQHLSKLGSVTTLRKKDGKDYLTDNGNLIADCQFRQIVDPAQLDAQLHAIPGVVESGLFLNKMVDSIIVGNANQTITILRPGSMNMQ